MISQEAYVNEAHKNPLEIKNPVRVLNDESKPLLDRLQSVISILKNPVTREPRPSYVSGLIEKLLSFKLEAGALDDLRCEALGLLADNKFTLDALQSNEFVYSIGVRYAPCFTQHRELQQNLLKMKSTKAKKEFDPLILATTTGNLDSLIKLLGSFDTSAQQQIYPHLILIATANRHPEIIRHLQTL